MYSIFIVTLILFFYKGPELFQYIVFINNLKTMIMVKEHHLWQKMHFYILVSALLLAIDDTFSYNEYW